MLSITQEKRMEGKLWLTQYCILQPTEAQVAGHYTWVLFSHLTSTGIFFQSSEMDPQMIKISTPGHHNVNQWKD